jgi:endonuclease/exonuclease/phosphatase family metal-dependent hydrolase
VTFSSLRIWLSCALLGVGAVLIAGCASAPAQNYLDSAGPRYAGGFRSGEADADNEETFLVVSFNVKMGEEPDNALKVLRNAGLDQADVLLLQEMDLEGTIEMAEDLGFNYVYYPATLHPWSHRLFGVAVLSPWPIQGDHKIRLPDFTDSRDPAAKASMVDVTWVKGTPVGVVNAHLQLGLSPVQVEEQVRVIVDCAFSGNCENPQAPLLPQLQYVVLAGDFNTSQDGKMRAADGVLTEAGLRRVPGIGRTYKYLFFGLGKLDHIYASPTLEVEESGQERGFFATGSDHFPVYARLRFNGEIPEPWQGFEPDESWATRPSSPTRRERR